MEGSLSHRAACVVTRLSSWQRGYPFNPGDLSVCITVANNYLDATPKVPWDDLRYIFG